MGYISDLLIQAEEAEQYDEDVLAEAAEQLEWRAEHERKLEEAEERIRRRVRSVLPSELRVPLYHYTRPAHLMPILASGSLRPSHDDHLLWLTTSPGYDAAGDLLSWDEDRRRTNRATSVHSAYNSGGLARLIPLGPVPGLQDWATTNREVPEPTRLHTEWWARKHSNSVRHWYTTPHALPVNGLRIEIWIGNSWRTLGPQTRQRLANWRDLLIGSPKEMTR